MDYMLIEKNIVALFFGIGILLLITIAIAATNWFAEAKKNERLTDVNASLREKLAKSRHEAYRLNYKLPEIDEDYDYGIDESGLPRYAHNDKGNYCTGSNEKADDKKWQSLVSDVELQ